METQTTPAATTPAESTQPGEDTSTKKRKVSKAPEPSYILPKDLNSLLQLASFMSGSYGEQLTPNELVKQSVIRYLAQLKKANRLVPTKQIDDLDKMQELLD